MAIPLLHRRITVDEFEQMIADGAFVENDRVELIDGEIVEMAALGIGHMNAVNYLTNLLTGIAPIRQAALVSVQNAILLPPDWEPLGAVAVGVPAEPLAPRSPRDPAEGLLEW